MTSEPVIHRAEVVALLFAVYDLVTEVQAIRDLLEGDDEAEGISD